VILKNLDRDYDEGLSYGMIGYYVPQRVYPPGYRVNPKQPLPFAGLTSQKNYRSLYLMAVHWAETTRHPASIPPGSVTNGRKRVRNSTWESPVSASRKSKISRWS
jgi:hypothetical protein